MHQIKIRPRARGDIKKIWRYSYENWGEKQADSYTEELEKAINSLIDNPEMGAGIEHIRQGYRLLHIEHHLVIYHLSTTVIDIARVLGESMDIKRHI